MPSNATENTVSEAFGLCCPRCGKDNRIEIAMTVWGLVTPDGTDIDEAESGDHEWTPDSAAQCRACSYGATVKAFTVEV